MSRRNQAKKGGETEWARLNYVDVQVARPRRNRGRLHGQIPMLAKLLELITGRDDLERVAYREDLGQLNAYLKARRLLIPRRPRRFLDAASFTPEQLLELLQEEAE